MSASVPETNKAISSLVMEHGELEVSLVSAQMPVLRDHEVLIKVQAAPINPSDLFLLLPGADMEQVVYSERGGLPVLTAPIANNALKSLSGRFGQPMSVGNEGSGVVVKAGASPEAQALLGKAVAVVAGGMYAEYRRVPASICMILPGGTDPRDAASCFVNPLTALGFVETAKHEKHSAIIHTAAASNLGQMLNRICIDDGIPLVNIVRSEEQVAILKGQGAAIVLNSTVPSFMDDLIEAIQRTGASIAFDAIGGGKMASYILAAMESVAVSRMTEYNRYGSNEFKQVYIYGALDLAPIVLNRTFGFRWSVSGWLLTQVLPTFGPETEKRMRNRILAELTTTFASTYSHEISLAQVLDPQAIAHYNARKTGDKYLIVP
ncbi:zinc-binding dehydrogenase [Sphingobium subterraneum]|uniref:NADPH:quinone reductase-like Zn-dependent oxidoreductase n=1 Tax=Sphingobium subterraneum TaxID=627688 RepID=A0A841J2V2_9SPHN|nr:zinc-binding dehydrogenase [Sphingobium subterraneum]MBB6125293.1 NADPH:quinone reductase-like Zn-dependent oxidoreductase [Sphingobium subterraneum]